MIFEINRVGLSPPMCCNIQYNFYLNARSLKNENYFAIQQWLCDTWNFEHNMDMVLCIPGPDKIDY